MCEALAVEATFTTITTIILFIIAYAVIILIMALTRQAHIFFFICFGGAKSARLRSEVGSGGEI